MIKVLFLILISVVALTSCSGGGVVHKFYVVIKPEETARFIETVTALAKEDGLETAGTRVAEKSGDASWIVEGWGHGVDLWVQSTLLSGKEDPKVCGTYSGPHSDPAQFTVSVEPKLFGTSAGAKELGERVQSKLQKSGFDVRRKPAICGVAVVGGRS